MAVSIVQGGGGYPFLCKGVYEYLTGQTVVAEYSAIPDFEVQEVAAKVITVF